jgi:hypothetical protein
VVRAHARYHQPDLFGGARHLAVGCLDRGDLVAGTFDRLAQARRVHPRRIEIHPDAVARDAGVHIAHARQPAQ